MAALYASRSLWTRALLWSLWWLKLPSHRDHVSSLQIVHFKVLYTHTASHNCKSSAQSLTWGLFFCLAKRMLGVFPLLFSQSRSLHKLTTIIVDRKRKNVCPCHWKTKASSMVVHWHSHCLVNIASIIAYKHIWQTLHLEAIFPTNQSCVNATFWHTTRTFKQKISVSKIQTGPVRFHSNKAQFQKKSTPPNPQCDPLSLR